MTSKTLNHYNTHAAAFQKQYLSAATQDVHKAWMADYLPSTGVVLDVGAGVGRDAKYFAEQDLEVIAVEPAEALLKLGKEYTQEDAVQWVQDTLPELNNVYGLQMRFDLILLSAVWMHIPASSRERAFRKLANLLKPNGYLVISLRHGPNADEREMFDVSTDELNKLSQRFGLSVRLAQLDDDKLDRPEVHWETVVMQLPDDGSGAFPIVRNILINDAKTSTYKLALIRTLLRIADGHPGAVLRREDKCVVLPLGFVALYWARQYKLVLDAGFQQNSNTNNGLGFVTDDGWNQLGEFSPLDLSIGNLFAGSDARALHRTLKHVARTIKNMPARYITFPGSENQVFEVEIKRTKSNVESLYLDLETLRSYGEFRVPINIWDLMTQYACWIEPVVLNEWAQVMSGFANNLSFEKHQLMARLEWQEAQRTTEFARAMVRQVKGVRCVWSNRVLKDQYHIDHCLPFARWPNNDLWNLLPTTTKINLAKSDKIPSNERFREARENIVGWWQDAWQEKSSKKFFTEASLSLPGLESTGENLDDIYEAMVLQSIRVVEMQRIARW